MDAELRADYADKLQDLEAAAASLRCCAHIISDTAERLKDWRRLGDDSVGIVPRDWPDEAQVVGAIGGYGRAKAAALAAGDALPYALREGLQSPARVVER
jgi:hypothetical protein